MKVWYSRCLHRKLCQTISMVKIQPFCAILNIFSGRFRARLCDIDFRVWNGPKATMKRFSCCIGLDFFCISLSPSFDITSMPVYIFANTHTDVHSIGYGTPWTVDICAEFFDTWHVGKQIWAYGRGWVANCNKLSGSILLKAFHPTMHKMCKPVGLKRIGRDRRIVSGWYDKQSIDRGQRSLVRRMMEENTKNTCMTWRSEEKSAISSFRMYTRKHTHTLSDSDADTHKTLRA